MRVVVHAGSVPEGSRLALAAAGLAARGHRVTWAGRGDARAAGARGFAGPRPATLDSAAGGLALARIRAEVVVGGGARPPGPAFAAWMVRADALVLGLSADEVARWSALDRWAWDSMHAAGLVEERDADAFRERPRGLDLERLGLWPDAAAPRAVDASHPDVEILERACERALARSRSRALRAAVFLDRDGTLVVERGYLADPDAIELLPGVAQAIRRLRAAGLAVVVVSNQAGVGRGLFPLGAVHAAMARLRAVLRPLGAEPDAIHFCPHHPDAGCACRKPGTALLERAAEDLLLSLRHSFVVGDKLLDAATGANAGARGVLVRTGYGRDEEARLAQPGAGPAPHAVCDDLGAAADWILGRVDPDA